MTRTAIAFRREMSIAVTIVLLAVACGSSARDINLEETNGVETASTNENLRLLCGLKSRGQVQTIRWYKDGQPLAPHGHLMQQRQWLRIKGFRARDAGVYSCVNETNNLKRYEVNIKHQTDVYDIEEFQADAARTLDQNLVAALVENNTIEEYATNNKTNKRNVPKTHENSNDADDEERDKDPGSLAGHVDSSKKQFPPKFKHPSKLFHMDMKPAGSSIRLKCAAEGNPIPNITWFKNNGSIERSYFKPSYGKWWLALDELSKTDNGNYTCLICNELGCISHTVNLQVQERLFSKPILTKGPANVTLLVGETAKFDCEFLSDLHHFVYWLFFREFEEYEKMTISNDTYANNTIIRPSDDPTDKPEMLTIANVTLEDQGWYVCVAQNTLGTATAKGYLTVLECKF